MELGCGRGVLPRGPKVMLRGWGRECGLESCGVFTTKQTLGDGSPRFITGTQGDNSILLHGETNVHFAFVVPHLHTKLPSFQSQQVVSRGFIATRVFSIGSILDLHTHQRLCSFSTSSKSNSLIRSEIMSFMTAAAYTRPGLVAG